MNCDIVKDLIPLYIDGCCSEKSEKLVKEHIENCSACKKLLEEMSSSSEVISVAQTPVKIGKLNDWKASVLQSVLLFASFLLITIGVALEARTPTGKANGFWALNLIVPTTGFMLSLANWYFVRIYKSRRCFSHCSLIATLVITVCAYVWSGFHYGMNIQVCNLLTFNGIGFLLTALFCMLSKILSDRYAKMLGKV